MSRNKDTYRLYFYYENNKLFSVFEDKTGNLTELNENKTLELLDGIYEYFNDIKSIRLKKNMSFYLNGIKVILLNANDFKNDDRFKYLFKYNENRYKLTKEVVLKGTIIGLSLVAILAAISHYTSDNKKEENIDSYNIQSYDESYETSNNEFIEEDNTEILLKEEQNEIKEVQEKYSDSEEEKDNNITKENNEIDNFIDEFKIGSEYNSEKAKTTRNLYYNIFEKYCMMYDLNPDILCAIGTQEEGIHDPEAETGGSLGLMQPLLSVWDNKNITVHNDSNNRDETIHITKEKLRDVDFNIKVGCAIFRLYLDEFKGNYPLAIVAYNMGDGKVREIIGRCAQDMNLTEKEIIENPKFYDWTKYIYSSDAGDSIYLMNTGRYMPEDIVPIMMEESEKTK